MNRPALVRFSIFLATVVACWGVLSLGSGDGTTTLQAGTVATQAYTAGRAATVEDVEATEAARQAARDEVEPVQKRNSQFEAATIDQINSVFDETEQLVVGDTAARSSIPLPDLPEPSTTTAAAGESTTTSSEPIAPGVVTGRLYLDVNGDGVFNPEAEGERVDQGLAGATVQVLADDGPHQLRTDVNGLWSFAVSSGAIVVTYDLNDPVIPIGWVFGPQDDSQLVECGLGESCDAPDVAIVTNLRPAAEIAAALAGTHLLQQETVEYLAATGREDLVRAPLGEPLHLPTVRQRALDTAFAEFGRLIAPTQLADVQRGVIANPPVVFHTDTGQDIAGGLAAGEVVAANLQANYIVDQEATDAAREARAAEVDPITFSYLAEQVIVEDRQVLTALDIAAIEATAIPAASGEASFGLLLVVGVLVSLVGLYLARFRPEFWSRPRMVSLLGILILLAATSVKATVAVQESTSWYVVPAVAFGFMTAVLFDQRIAILMALSVGVLTAVGSLDAGITVYAVLAALAPVAFVSSVSTRGAFRNAVVVSGAAAGVIAVATSWFFHVTPGDPVFMALGVEFPYTVVLEAVAWAFGVSVLASLVGLAALQFFESAFDITTTLSLLDLTDRNHRALQLLQEKAFGTFNHSLMVGTLADAAARSIGADPLLARAMAYYHDLGKTENPSFYIENQFGIPNPHDQLPPQESAEIIRSHVTAGVALAREFKIPTDVAQGIVSHHGDGVMRYFYEKAREIHGHEVDIEQFRHVGHKPRTAETAILMMADSLEAACRAHFQTEEPTPDAIEKVVNRVMDEKIEDGQLMESPLTLGELTSIRRAFLESLVGHYHQRIAYPNFPGS